MVPPKGRDRSTLPLRHRQAKRPASAMRPISEGAGIMQGCSIFGHHDGQKVYEAALRSSAGATAKIITYGAVVRDLIVPVGNGSQRVVNGLRTLEDYVRYSPHFGAIAGRYANRIGGGHFMLDGE